MDKLRISVFSSLLLVAILKFVHIDGLTSGVNRILQISIFFVISLLAMPKLREDTLLKVKFSLYGSLIAFFVTSPEVGELVGNYNGSTTQGLLIYGLMYIAFLLGVMYLPEVTK